MLGVDLASSGASAIGALGILLLLLIGLAWFIVAATVAVKGGPMEQPNRVAQLYGYTVCLIGLVVALTTTGSLINAAIDRGNPLQTEFPYGISLSTFEAYKITQQRERGVVPRSEAGPIDTASEVTLRARYDALVADRIATTRYRTSKTFVSSGILLVLAIILFVTHWRWLRRLSDAARAG